MKFDGLEVADNDLRSERIHVGRAETAKRARRAKLGGFMIASFLHAFVKTDRITSQHFDIVSFIIVVVNKLRHELSAGEEFFAGSSGGSRNGRRNGPAVVIGGEIDKRRGNAIRTPV